MNRLEKLQSSVLYFSTTALFLVVGAGDCIPGRSLNRSVENDPYKKCYLYQNEC